MRIAAYSNGVKIGYVSRINQVNPKVSIVKDASKAKRGYKTPHAVMCDIDICSRILPQYGYSLEY